MEDTTREKKQETEFRDQQHELAGLDVGRQQRFLPEETNSVRTYQKKKDKLSAWEILLLTQPQYAALYQEVEDTLNRAEKAVHLARATVDAQLEQAQERLDHLTNRSHILADGSHVFYSEDQDAAYTDKGRRLSEEEKNRVEWDSSRPSWEEYRDAQKAVKTAQQEKANIEAYEKHVLAPAKERMNDRDHPPSEEELEDILNQINDHMPKSVKKAAEQLEAQSDEPSVNFAAESISGKSNLNTPDIDGQFRSAGIGLPDLGEIQPADNSGLELKR